MEPHSCRVPGVCSAAMCCWAHNNVGTFFLNCYQLHHKYRQYTDDRHRFPQVNHQLITKKGGVAFSRSQKNVPLTRLRMPSLDSWVSRWRTPSCKVGITRRFPVVFPCQASDSPAGTRHVPCQPERWSPKRRKMRWDYRTPHCVPSRA
jgi:hypothetical protein